MSNEIDPHPQQYPEVAAIIADLTKLMIGETVVVVPAEQQNIGTT